MSVTGELTFDPWPEGVQVHVEWGPIGAAEAAARNDAVVVVDVFCFSTSVAIALSGGASVTSLPRGDLERLGGPEAVALALNAEMVCARRTSRSRYSLSPVSVADVRPGDRLVITSSNGAAAVAAATGAPGTLLGSFVNRTAVAACGRELLRHGDATRITLVACGEEWSSVATRTTGLRPCIEDWLGAGAIAATLDHEGFSLSTEAVAAAAAFRSAADDLGPTLHAVVGGRELATRGYAGDVALAAAVDSCAAVPTCVPGPPRAGIPGTLIVDSRSDGE